MTTQLKMVGPVVSGMDGALAEAVITAIEDDNPGMDVDIDDQGNIDSRAVKLFANVRHSLGRLGCVDSHPNHLGAGQSELFDLNGGTNHVNRVRVGHRLNTHRRTASHRDDSRPPNHLRLSRISCRRTSRE